METLLQPSAAWTYTSTVTPTIANAEGGIVKLGTDRLNLEDPGLFAGGVDIQQGVVRLLDSDALGTPAVQNNAPVLAAGGGLASGTSSYYVVNAITPNGPIASNVESIIPTGGNDTVDLSWNAVNGATGYNVYRTTTAGNYTNTL